MANGETVETVADFIVLGSKITADSDCRHEIKRHLLLGRKVMTNLDSILKKQRHDLANKGLSSQGYGFPSSHVWMWELDYKERIDAFELWCWRIFLRVPWTARRTNQSILKEISPGCSLEGLMLKLKLRYFGHQMRRAGSLEKTLMVGRLRAGGERDNRGWEGRMPSPTPWTWIWVDSGSWWWTGRSGVVHAKSRTRLSNWTELN